MAGTLRQRFRDPNLPVPPSLLAVVRKTLDAGILDIVPLTRPGRSGRLGYDPVAESLPATIFRSLGLPPERQWTSTRGPHVFTSIDTAAHSTLCHSALLRAAGSSFAQPACYSMSSSPRRAANLRQLEAGQETPDQIRSDLRRLALVAADADGERTRRGGVEAMRTLLLDRFRVLFADRATLRRLQDAETWRRLPLERFEHEACLDYAPHRFDLVGIVEHLDALLALLIRESQRGIAVGDGGVLRTVDAGLALWSELASPLMPWLGHTLKAQLLETRHVDRYLRYTELVDLDRRPELHVEPLFMLPH